MNTPILFLIFNRPDTTFKVFDTIKQAKPRKLYIASDGPRRNNIEEKKLCLESRTIINKIDWDCDVKLLFRENNLGCKFAVSEAIDWFFQNEEEGIILEDDVLPCREFYDFCEQMLIRYRNDTRVMMITGNNLLGGNLNSSEYYFSEFYSIWGWATWKRCWSTYDVKLKSWPDNKKRKYLKQHFNKKLYNYFNDCFDLIVNEKIDTWDHQWTYNCIYNSGYSITPRANLITNIGVIGTHSPSLSENHFIPYGKFDLKNINHPEYIIVDHESDNIYSKYKIKSHSNFRKICVKILKKIGLFSIIKKQLNKICKNF